LAQEQKKKEKANRKLEKDKAKEQKRKPIDPNSITLGGPVLVKATNEIINKASERKIPEGWLMHLVNEGNLGEIQRTKYPREELDYQTKYGQVKCLTVITKIRLMLIIFFHRRLCTFVARMVEVQTAAMTLQKPWLRWEPMLMPRIRADGPLCMQPASHSKVLSWWFCWVRKPLTKC